MKVRMVEVPDGGWHDGEGWRSYPAVGKVLETDDLHGKALCESGRAVPVAERAVPETRPAAQPVVEHRGPGRPRKYGDGHE